MNDGDQAWPGCHCRARAPAATYLPAATCVPIGSGNGAKGVEMAELYTFRKCPNCRQRPSLLAGLRIYRCRVCQRFCCDKCVGTDWFRRYCPHCEAKSSLELVGAAS